MMPHRLAQAWSKEGFGFALMLAWIFLISLSLKPVVAVMALIGRFPKKVLAVVTVPGSRLGKLAMNWASSQFKFCAKWMRPADYTILDKPPN